MGETALIYAAACAVGFAWLAKRFERTILTAPIFFLAAGFLISGTGWADPEAGEPILHAVAETTLVILLFLDASQVDLMQFRKQHVWPQRMLLVGLPLAVLIGTGAGYLLLPGWPLVALALVAALLAPTDAALGQSIVTNLRVPERVRRGLTVESGLNDGLALPIILLLAALLGEMATQDAQGWLLFGLGQVLLGPLAGIVIGLAGGWITLHVNRRGWTSRTYEGIAALSLAGLCYLGATAIGGNGFIAAFVGGLCFGNLLQGRCEFLFEFTEGEGQLLMWAAFFLLGFVLLPEAIEHLSWPIMGLIFASLFIVRPLAIWLSLIGTDAAPATRLFFGWFGPRGLATALFALLIIPQVGEAWAEPILVIAINAVWISALLHGMSALPLGNLYARRTEQMGECAETMDVADPFERVEDDAATSPQQIKSGD
ncbi:sodium:proton antiporter [Parasphingopyxis sp. CP4]|uniref:cation:proton antiporter n=1 Tax=Parasphingopyxis sp. CP4 TaxID=2724527 RepID=UPI001C40A071|nr:cation:proton antiporter [Parasphingopyxis sp. CP4]